METAYVIFVFLILAEMLNVGDAIRCHECFPRFQETCNASELIHPPVECSRNDYRKVPQWIKFKKVDTVVREEFACIKVSLTGFSQTKIIRMCAPATITFCRVVEDFTRMKYEEVGVKCLMCFTDACNTAAASISTPLLIVLTIAAIVISKYLLN